MSAPRSSVAPQTRPLNGRRTTRRRALAVAQFLLLPVLLLGFAPPAAAEVIGSPGSGFFTGETTGFTHEVTSTVTPDNIDPGEPVSVTWTRHSVGTSGDNGGLCVPGDSTSQTGPLTSAILHKVGPGGSYWNPAPGFEVYNVAVAGTETHQSQFLCGPPRLDLVDEWTYEVPGSSTAQLPQGCYHITIVNQHLFTSENSDGTLAAFTVGDGSCTAAADIDVTANFDYLGLNAAKPNFSLSGFDRAAVTGDGASKVARTCVRSDWTATIKLSAPTSTPLFWNGQTFPFTDEHPEAGAGVIWTGVTRSAPQIIKGVPKFNRTYFETIRMEYCVAGTEAVLRRSPLTVSGPGNMVSVQHRTAALAYDDNGNLLASVVTATKTGKKKVFSLGDTVTQTFRLT
jgi:hypothetical protein